MPASSAKRKLRRSARYQCRHGEVADVNENHVRVAVRDLREGHAAATLLRFIVQRGEWDDESAKSRAASICAEVVRLLEAAISCAASSGQPEDSTAESMVTN